MPDVCYHQTNDVTSSEVIATQNIYLININNII